MFNLHGLHHTIATIATIAASTGAQTLLRWVALAALLAGLVIPASAAQAAETSQGALNACKVNGQLVVPIIVSGKSSAWVFVTNFDQPLSRTTVAGCLATRNASGTTYLPDNYCTVMNNTANQQFGGGVAQFDDNAYLQCTIPNPPEPAPLFWVHARASLPTTLNGDSFTLLASQLLSFTVNTDAACLLTLNSRYNTMLFSHTTVNRCSSFVDLNSNLVQTTATPKGNHRIGLTNLYGPTNLTGLFALPANLSFTIGAVGETFTLDYLVIDPPGNCCNPK